MTRSPAKSEADSRTMQRVGPIHQAAFSPNGRWAVTSGWGGSARLWDTTTCKSVAQFFGNEGIVGTSTFSPDGTRLVTAGHDGTARIYAREVRAPVEELMSLARSRVTRPLTREERQNYLHESPSNQIATT